MSADLRPHAQKVAQHLLFMRLRDALSMVSMSPRANGKIIAVKFGR